MTYRDLVRRGRLLLVACLCLLLVGMLASDAYWGGLWSSRDRIVVRYGAMLGLGFLALRGASWARQALAGLLAAGVVLSLVHVVQLGRALPMLSAWLVAHAAANALIAGTLSLSSSIARYEASRNPLLNL